MEVYSTENPIDVAIMGNLIVLCQPERRDPETFGEIRIPVGFLNQLFEVMRDAESLVKANG